jgi:hypothetical protein
MERFGDAPSRAGLRLSDPAQRPPRAPVRPFEWSGRGEGFREAAWLNEPSHGMIRVMVSRETVPDEAMDEVSVRTAEMLR